MALAAATERRRRRINTTTSKSPRSTAAPPTAPPIAAGATNAVLLADGCCTSVFPLAEVGPVLGDVVEAAKVVELAADGVVDVEADEVAIVVVAVV